MGACEMTGERGGDSAIGAMMIVSLQKKNVPELRSCERHLESR